MSPKSLKKRSKTLRACVACRSQKKKCSGTKPCDHCSRLQRSCTYRADERRYHILALAGDGQSGNHLVRLPNDPARCASPSVELLPDAHEAGEVRSPPGSSQEHVTFALPPHQHSSVNLDADSRGAYSTEASRPGSMEPTSKDPAGNAVGSISAYTWVQRAFMRLNKARKLSANRATIDDDALPTRITEYGDANPDLQPLPLPLHEITGVGHYWLQKLADCFFERACATYRYLHRPTVNSWICALACNDVVGLGPAQLAVSCSLLAHGCLYLRDDEASLMGFAEAAVLDSERLLVTSKYHLDRERGPPTLESVQARLVLVHFLLSSGRPNQAWYTFGLAAQLTLAMGLHQRRPRRDDPSILHREMSCRVFWSVYVTDKYLSITLGRPTLVHDDGITERNPSAARDEWLAEAATSPATEHEDHNSEIEATVLQAKLCRIINRVISSNYETGTAALLKATAENNAQLDEWQRQVPPHFSGAVRPSSLIPVFQRQAIVLRLFQLHAVMLTNRPLLLQSFAEPRDSSPSDADSAAIQKGVDACVSSALDVVNWSIQFAAEGQRFAVFWFTQNVAFIAISILYLSALRTLASSCAGLSVEEERLLSQAHRAHQCLADASQGNSPGLRYAVVLEELRKEVSHQLQSHDNGAVGFDSGVQVPDATVSTMDGDGATGPGSASEIDFDGFDVADTSLFWPDFDALLLNNAFM